MSEEDVPESTTRPRWVRWLVGFAVAAVIALAVGFIGHLSGAGWFGYRDWLHDGGELYALNMSKSPLRVSVDGREPVEVPPEDARILEILGGTTVVDVTDAAGESVATYDVTVDGSHAFLKLTDDGCLAVVDITPFYGGEVGAKLDFEAYLHSDARLWIPRSRNVVWPRKDFPSRLEGGEGNGIWFELVACELLEEPEFLDAYLAVRLESRMAAALGKKKK